MIHRTTIDVHGTAVLGRVVRPPLLLLLLNTRALPRRRALCGERRAEAVVLVFPVAPSFRDAFAPDCLFLLAALFRRQRCEIGTFFGIARAVGLGIVVVIVL